MANKINIEFDHSNLSNLYVGQFGEQLVKLYFIVNGIDTYEPLIDDKGIDFVARVSDEKFYDVQVKTVRLKKECYIYITKETWNYKLRENLLVAFVVLEQDLSPTLLLIPSTAWQTDTTTKILANRDYIGKKSKPEWGITINKKNLQHLIDNYEIDKTITNILPDRTPAGNNMRFGVMAAEETQHQQ